MKSSLELKFGYSLKDMNGSIKKELINQPSHSFVKAFIQILFANTAIAEDSSLTIVDTLGTSRTPDNFTFSLDGPLNNDTRGLLVGTGTTAETIDDFSLDTQISHGTSAGELQYGSHTFGAPSSDSSSTSMIVTRTFTNNSGGSITIEEIGLTTFTNNFNFLIIRDVLGASSVTIDDAEEITFNYTIKTNI